MRIIFFIISFLGCGSITMPDGECFDYSGSATWLMSADALILEMPKNQGDFEGTVTARIDSADSATAVMSGILTSPLMQNKKSYVIHDTLVGKLLRDSDDLEIKFVGIGDSLELYLSWNRSDDLIWYNGSACR